MSKLRVVMLLSAVFCAPILAFAHGDTPFGTAGVIHACREPITGLIRQINSGNCLRTETIVHWNITGPMGPAGPSGCKAFRVNPVPQVRKASWVRTVRPDHKVRQASAAASRSSAAAPANESAGYVAGTFVPMFDSRRRSRPTNSRRFLSACRLAGTLSRLSVVVDEAVEGRRMGRVFLIVLGSTSTAFNPVETSLRCSIGVGETTCTNTTDVLPIAAGDFIAGKMMLGFPPTPVRWTAVFTAQ